MQRELKSRNAALPEERRIQFRIGINLGDVIEDRGDVYGDGVNVAARLEALAAPGSICISGSVYDAVAARLPLSYEFLGEQEVKNIARPVRAYHARLDPDLRASLSSRPPRIGLWRLGALAAGLALALGAALLWLEPWAPPVEPASVERMAYPLPDKPSVVVMPFVNMSSDAGQEFLADGFTEDLTTDLSHLSGLLVIARNSAFTYKGRSVLHREVAEDLGVRYIVEGSIRRVEQRLRINVQLVDAVTGHHLWAERYDGEMGDVFSFQDRVLGQLVSALSIEMTGEEGSPLEGRQTESAEAYTAVLEAWDHYHRETPDDALEAIALFERALELDPGYAHAHAGLARMYWEISNRWWFLPLETTWQHTFDLAKKHLAAAMRAPNADAYALAAEINARMGRYDRALGDIDRAIAMGPSIADNNITKAGILNSMGRAEEAERLVRFAMRLDPHFTAAYARTLGRSLLHQGRYEEAAEFFALATARGGDDPNDFASLAVAYGHLGRIEAARAAIDRYHEVYREHGYSTPLTVQEIDKWWYGDMFDYHPPYREGLMAGLRKAGVAEGPAPPEEGFEYRHRISRDDEGLAVDGAPTIDLATAKALWERGVTAVDVRDTIAFDAGHMPRAVHLDVHVDFTRERLLEFVELDDPVVIGCWGEDCPYAAHACAKAVAWGFTNVYYFRGGFPAWKAAGLPVEKSETGALAADGISAE